MISISPKGRRFADKVFEIKDMHTSTTAFHDIKIFSKTLTLSKTELESAKTESQIRKELKTRLGISEIILKQKLFTRQKWRK